MFKEFSNNKDDDYLSEFRQKIASERQAELLARKQEIQRSRNGFVGTIAGIVLAGFVSWFLLVPGFNNKTHQETPIIRRPVTPVKIQPNNPGGMEILNQDKPVYNLVEKQEVKNIKVESILPTPETPKLPEIVPEPKIVQKNSNIEKPVTDLEVKNLDELIEKIDTDSNKKIQLPQKPEKIDIEVKTAEAVKTEIKTEVKNEAKKAEVVKEELNKTTQQKANAAEIDINGDEIWQLQLMASSNMESVKKSWTTLSEKHTQLKKINHEIETATLDNGSTVYRLKAGLFSSRESADDFCNTLKQQGLNCIVKQK